MEWSDVFGGAALIPLLNAGIRLAIPTGLAAVGESFCQRSGVLNLSLEGMMLTGALTSYLGAYYSGALWVGVPAGIGGGLRLCQLHPRVHCGGEVLAKAVREGGPADYR